MNPDLERCKEVVCSVMRKNNIDPDDYDIDLITKEIMSISEAKGGSCSNDMMCGFAKGYFDHGLHSQYPAKKKR